jgi:hypothetical protein
MFAAGFVAASAAWVWSIGPYTRMLVINYQMAQVLLADRASRANDPLAEVVHRWNAVSASTGEGFYAFRQIESQSASSKFLTPAAMLGLWWYTSGIPLERGDRIEEAIERGRLALSLETLGFEAEAQAQWQRGVALGAARDPERLRAMSRAVASVDTAQLEALYLSPQDR